jgi:hypothetical protein
VQEGCVDATFARIKEDKDIPDPLLTPSPPMPSAAHHYSAPEPVPVVPVFTHHEEDAAAPHEEAYPAADAPVVEGLQHLTEGEETEATTEQPDEVKEEQLKEGEEAEDVEDGDATHDDTDPQLEQEGAERLTRLRRRANVPGTASMCASC